MECWKTETLKIMEEANHPGKATQPIVGSQVT